MPEFILDTSGAESDFAKLSPFVQGYIEALYFTDEGPGSVEEWQAPGFEPAEGCFPSECGFADLAPEALERIKRDCAAFQTAAADLLALAYARPGYSEEQAGRDFHFTRNGHGVGYWDRKQLESDSAEYEELTAAMIEANGRGDSEAWGAALSKRNAIAEESLGRKLSALCGHGTPFGNVDSYLGDDGKVYI